jgi:hypothetical protein
MRGARSVALAVLVVAALSVPARGQVDAPPAPDVPAGSGAIAGRVVRAADGMPAGEVEVVLYALPSDAPPGLRRGRSGPDGRFAFERIDAVPSTTYLVGARYHGVSYPGARVQFAAGEERREVEVRVHDVTDDVRGAEPRALRLRLDWAGDRLLASETLSVSNPGTRTLLVPPERRGRAAPALALDLPPGARNATGPLGLLPEGVVVAGETLRWYGPLFPGENELSISYEVPVREGRVDLARALAAPLRVTLLVPAGGPEVDAPGLAPGETTMEQGRGYRTFEGDVGAGRLALALRVPAARTDPSAVSLAEVRVIGELDAAAFVGREEHVIRVEGDTPVVAAGDAPLVAIPLPAGASDLRFGAPESGTRLAPLDEGGLGVLGPLPPGETVLELRYRIPAEAGGSFTLARRFGAHVPLLSVYVADNGRLDARSERLHRRRPVKTPDRTYLHFEAFELAPNEEPALTLALRPPRRELPRAATVALVGLAAGLVAFALAAPLRGPRVLAGAVPEPGARDRLQEERDALAEALADLEHDFETGKLEATDYAAMREELASAQVGAGAEDRAHASSEDGAAAGHAAQGNAGERPSFLPSDPSAPSTPTPGCNACGHATAAGDRFCARCGARLLAA